MKVAFNDLRPQYKSVEQEIRAAVDEVFDAGQFILGRQGEALEREFAAYCGAAHGVAVASGTDALWLALLAMDVGPGDEVITVANTALPTVAAISKSGATPVLVDVSESSMNMDVESLSRAITPRTKVIIPVHLYGQPAEMAGIMAVARAHGVKVLEDACQAHGARYQGTRVGAIGDAAAFSFYPTKNFGAYGDGGMVLTGDEGLVHRLRLLRDYGQRERYQHVSKGHNSRLDELQAAILRVKLRHLDEWNQMRVHKAGIYTDRLLDSERLRGVVTPVLTAAAEHVFHLYVIRAQRREALRDFLSENGVATAIHYPTPVHFQEAYADLHLCEGSLPVSERAAREVLSLPMYPDLPDDHILFVADLVNSFFCSTRSSTR